MLFKANVDFLSKCIWEGVWLSTDPNAHVVSVHGYIVYLDGRNLKWSF